jgi:hypothetical protein
MKLSIANGGVVQYPTKALYDILTNHVINVISASDPAVTHNQGDQCHVISHVFGPTTGCLPDRAARSHLLLNLRLALAFRRAPMRLRREKRFRCSAESDV